MGGVATDVHDGMESNQPQQNAKNFPIITIPEKIEQGKKIQQKKQLQFSQENDKPLHLIGDGKGKRKNTPVYSPRRKHLGVNFMQTKSESYHNDCTTSPTDRPASPIIKKRIRSACDYAPTSKPVRCPLRIAELAEPSKRQCIDTWRCKSHTLPPFMLERLKSHVTGQKVVARVSDAVECFKSKPASTVRRRKSNTNDRGGGGLGSRSKMSTSPNSGLNYDVRDLCGVFGQLIALKLVRPSKIQLCQNLETLSETVALEIRKLMHKNKKYRTDYSYDPLILKEMSDKITVWISDIIKQSEQKLIEDDLRAKKMEQRYMGNNDKLVTLIETYFDKAISNNQDLEEDEGPALDAVDTIISNVMSLCESDGESTYASPENESVNNDAAEGIENGEEHSENEGSSIKKDSIESMRGIHDIVRDPNRTESDGSKYDTSVDMNEASIVSDAIAGTEEAFNVSDDNLVNLEESLDERKKVKFSNLSGIGGSGEGAGGSGEGTGGSDGDGTGTGSGSGPGAGSMDGSGSGAGGGSDHSGGGGGGGSDHSRGGGGGGGGAGGGGRAGGGGGAGAGAGADRGIVDKQSKLPIPSERGSNDSFASNKSGHRRLELFELHLKPPKHSILSIVDEGWPSDLDMHHLKPSASVSKSITSLGNINETDENVDDSNSYLPDNKFSDEIISGQKEYTSSQIMSIEKELVKNDINDTNTESAAKKTQDDGLITDAITAGIDATNNELRRIQNKDEKNALSDTEELLRLPSPILTSEEAKIVEAANVYSDPKEIQVKDNKSIQQADTLMNYLTQPQDADTRDSIIDSAETKMARDAKGYKHVGKGDHNRRSLSLSDRDPELDRVYRALQDKHKKPKFDYRVHPQTAPPWALIDEGSEESLSVPGHRPLRRMGSSELRKWCKDMDRTLDNLQEWKNWLQVTCKKLLLQKQRTDVDNAFNHESRNQYLREWTEMKRCIDRDAKVWRKLNQRTSDVLRHYEMSQSQGKTVGEINRRRRNQTKKNIVQENIYTIEGLSLWLHRSIVSAECCFCCNCKRIPRKSPTRNPEAPSCSGRNERLYFRQGPPNI